MVARYKGSAYSAKVEQLIIDRITDYRLDRNMTQADISQALGMSRFFWKNYEAGIARLSLRVLIDVAEVLEITLQELLEGI